MVPIFESPMFSAQTQHPFYRQAIQPIDDFVPLVSFLVCHSTFVDAKAQHHSNFALPTAQKMRVSIRCIEHIAEDHLTGHGKLLESKLCLDPGFKQA